MLESDASKHRKHGDASMPAKGLPPVERLREYFVYDSKTGQLRWKERLQRAGRGGRQVAAGTIAGGINHNGYVRIRLDGLKYFAHRIVWKMATGEDPPAEIDHKDGNPTNNRLENLRVVTRTEQVWNSGPRKDNTSGFRGVYSDGRGKWKVDIGELYLGRFGSPEEASRAYEAVAIKCYGKFYRRR